MGHYASEMGYTDRKEWYDGTGFVRISWSIGSSVVACRTCRVVFWANYDREFLLQHRERCQ